MSRWLAFALLLTGCAALMVSLSPPYSTLAFIGMVAAAIGVSWISATPQQRKQGIAVVRALFSARVWMLAALVLMGLSAYHFAQGVTATGTAMGLALGGWVMLGVGRLTSPRGPLSIQREGELTSPSGQLSNVEKGSEVAMRWRWLLGALLALTLLASINGWPQEDNDLPLIGWQWYVPAQVQFALLWGGLAMLVWSTSPPNPLSKRGEGRDARTGKGVEAFHETPLPIDSFLNWEKAALAAIVLLALALRLWNLDGLIHRFIDEIHFANAVVRLQNEPNLKILLPFGGVTAFTWVFPHFEWLSVSLFGPSLASLRLPSAVMGALNVWALYWLAKALFERKTALLAALFLATFPPHLHFSRLALNNIADPLFGTLALGFVARALRSPGVRNGTMRLANWFYPYPRPFPRIQGKGESPAREGGFPLSVHEEEVRGWGLDSPATTSTGMNHHAPTMNSRALSYWALAGVCLGLTQYFYEGGKLLFPPLVMLWLGWLAGMGILTRWGRADIRGASSPLPKRDSGEGSKGVPWNAPTVGRRGILRGVLLLALTTLLVAAPLYYSLAATYNLFSPRLFFTSWVTNQQTEPLPTAEGFLWHTVNSVPYALTAFVQLTDASWFYSGETPLVLPVLVPLLLLGAAQAVWRVRSPGGSLLVLWIMGTVLGNSVLSQATHYPRFVVAFPAVALLMALGLRTAWAMIFEPPRREGRQESSQLSAVSFQPELNRQDAKDAKTAVRQSTASGHWHAAQSAALIVLALLLAFVQTQYYFGAHMQAFFVQNRLSKDTDDALFRALDLPPDTDVMIVGKQILWSYNVDTVLQFFRRTDLNVLSYAPSDFVLVLRELPLNRDYAIFVEPEDLDTARLLRERFGDIGAPQVSPYAVPMDKHYVMYWVSGKRD